MRRGILGGAFNPPHVGHLVCAQEAHAQLGLDLVELMPVCDAPHRELVQDPGPRVRLDLVERAVAGDERLAASALEVQRAGRSYTADTLRALRELEPEDELTLILGADQAASLPAWREPEAVLELATVAVAERGGTLREEVLAACEQLSGAERITFFAMPRIDISSSSIRDRAASGRPIRYLVRDSVAEVIAAKSLYGSPEPVGLR